MMSCTVAFHSTVAQYHCKEPWQWDDGSHQPDGGKMGLEEVDLQINTVHFWMASCIVVCSHSCKPRMTGCPRLWSWLARCKTPSLHRSSLSLQMHGARLTLQHLKRWSASLTHHLVRLCTLRLQHDRVWILWVCLYCFASLCCRMNKWISVWFVCSNVKRKLTACSNAYT